MKCIKSGRNSFEIRQKSLKCKKDKRDPVANSNLQNLWKKFHIRQKHMNLAQVSVICVIQKK